MKLNEAILFEAFDSPYKLDRLSHKSASFRDDDGNTFVIEVESFEGLRTDMLIHNLVFLLMSETGRDHKYSSKDIKASGNPIRVFSTVVAYLRQFMNDNPSTTIGFSGEKALGHLYSRMLSQLKGSYRVSTKTVGSYIDFCIVNKNNYIQWGDDLVNDVFDMLDGL